MDTKQTEYGYFITDMPASRQADYYLGYDGGSVFIDFNNGENGCVYLVRISFDGYGCCHLRENVTPMDTLESAQFKDILNAPSIDQPALHEIVKRTVHINKALLWEDALKEYSLV